MAHAKIIGIHDGKHIETGQSARPLPAPIIHLRDEFKGQMKSLLIKLFDNADDALFAMADKAGSDGDQSIYFKSMRELRLQKKMIANSFLQQIVLSFTNVDHISEASKKEADTNNLENLSILKNEDLEVSVALEGMASRLRNNASDKLDDFHKRIESLVRIDSLKLMHTPASPEVLCDALEYASANLDVDLKAKLIIFKLFERYVLNEMPEVYQSANQSLIKLGVLPTLKSQKNKTKSAPASSGQTNDPDQSVPVLGKEQCLTEVQFEQIRSLMHSGALNQSFNQASGTNVVFINQDQIISTLSEQQFSNTNHVIDENVKGYQAVDFRSLIANAHENQSGKKVKYEEIDNDIINLVSMLFDFILDDKQLQPTMKALISRLQIPILKAALLDKSFFDRGGHPARKLLNEMASAAIGWTEKSTGKSDRLKSKIESIVERILTSFDSNLELFEELLHEFTQFTDLENRRGQLIEQRTKDSEKGKAATELAKKATETVINTVLESNSFRSKEIPECVVTILTEGWSRVMILDYLKLGDASTEWKGHQLFVHNLVWSVCPSSDGSDARGKLLQLIPTLVRRLHQGLHEVSFDEFRLTKLLGELEKVHIATLKRLHKQVLVEQEETAKRKQEKQLELDSKAAVTTPVSTVAPSSAESKAQDELKSSLDIEDEFKEFQERLSSKEINDVLNKHHEKTNPESAESDNLVQISLTEAPADLPDVVLSDDDPFMQQVARFSVGCWFEFTTNGQTERAKLAAVIKVNGRYIFVNRSGVKVAEKTKQDLAKDLKSGSIQVLNDGLLFDRALESIIGNLRGQA